MWFRFPAGASTVSIQLQDFYPEAQDADGRDCFRAPDHFAPIILDLPGFGYGKPLGDLEDLPPADPQREQTIALLANQIEGLKMENESLRAVLAETKVERDEWKLKALNFEAEITQLKEEQDADEDDAGPTLPGLLSKDF